MSMKKMIRQRRQPARDHSGKRYGALPEESSGIRRPRFRGNRGKYIFAIHSVNAITIAQVFLYCTILNHNIQYSNSLIRNSHLRRLPPTLSITSRNRDRGILRSLSVSLSASDTISKGKHAASATRKSVSSSVNIDYRPSKKYRKDFRTHEDQERLDWMVRNTAKILGEDASRTLRFVVCCFKICN